MNSYGKLATGLAAMLAMAGAAQATPLVVNMTAVNTADGHTLSAQAMFDVSASNLVITLTNTSTGNPGYQPSDVLLGLFFNVSGNPALSAVSAALTDGTDSFVDAPLVGNLGDYWQYKRSLSGFSNSVVSTTDAYGIGGAGFGGIFGGAGGYFSAGGSSSLLDGVDYGIVGNDFNDAAANGGIHGHGPYEENSVTYTLSGLGAGFDPFTMISSVVFAYGTAPDSTYAACLPGDCLHQETPEPGTLAAIGSGLSMMGALFFRRRRRG
jgi:hypothetical protein